MVKLTIDDQVKVAHEDKVFRAKITAVHDDCSIDVEIIGHPVEPAPGAEVINVKEPATGKKSKGKKKKAVASDEEIPADEGAAIENLPHISTEEIPDDEKGKAKEVWFCKNRKEKVSIDERNAEVLVVKEELV